MNNLRTASITQIANLYSEKGSDLTYKDLKIECIIRGMNFNEVVKSDFFYLANWLSQNISRGKNQNLLDQFDDWVESQIRDKDLIHPSLRLGYIQRDEDDLPKPKKEKIVKEKKPPREKDSRGLFKGTMKSYTYLLQEKGKTLEQVTLKVTRKFPNAKPKSIKIWFNKAKKGK
jgi:hypothetical protein